MRNLFLALLLLLSSVLSFSQKTDRNLQSQIEESIMGFNGDIGIYIKNLRTGKIMAINADSIFPTASIVKVPILLWSDG
jgi:beta-lactamase class A